MHTVPFGKTDLQITPIGLGTWAIGGGGWSFGWGPQDDKRSIEAIHRALDLGMNWIDTAAVYGLGHAEEVIAEALKGRSEKPYIFTKCSLVWDDQGRIGNNMQADSVRREVEASLRRLQVDVIDLYQIHWPNPEEQIEEGWTTLAELKAEGKVRHIGVSNFHVSHLERAQAIAPVETLQPPYSMIKRKVENETLPYCHNHNIGVIVYSPMYSGMLTGKMTQERVAQMPEDDWRRRDREFQEPKLSQNLALADFLAGIGQRHGRAPGEVAIAWTLRNPAVTAAIVGGRNAEQVDGIIGAMDFRLSDAEIAEIDQYLQQM